MRASTASWSVLGQLHRPGQPDDVRHVLGAGPASALLVAADHERPEGRAAAHEEDADALGGVQLVAGEGEQIDVGQGPPEVEGKLADRLRGVGVEDDRRVGLLGEARQLLDGEDHAGLVVGVHDGREQGVRAGAPG